MSEQAAIKVKRARPIEEIFQEVRSYDLVLTVDAPLSDALNARLESSRLGHFATTPRRLALDEIRSDKKIFRDKRELFLKIIEDTDLDWKRATYLLDDIVEAWKETGDPSKVLEQDVNKKEDMKKILKTLKETINPYTSVERYNIDKEKDVAVISEYQFTDLDKKILPEEYDNIEVFTDARSELPPFNIFNSTSEIIDTVLDQIKDIDARDAAVVMEKNSQYRYLMEATMDSNDVPYMVSKKLKDCGEIRKLLNTIRASFFRKGLKVRDIRGLVSEDDSIDTRTEEYLLNSYEDRSLDKIKDVLDEIPELTFEQLLERYKSEDEIEDVRRHLDELELLERGITYDRLNSFIHYMESFDIEVESAGQGVLIASPGTSIFIDRPYVFYLGMDTSWTPEPPTTPWTDKKEFNDRKRKDIEILLQNGEQQFYLVKNSEMGQKVIPSFYLNEFCRSEIGSFKDIKHELKEKDLKKPERPFTKMKVDTDIEPVDMISQSTLNSLTRCPKDQFFSELVDVPDKKYFKRGTIFHDFAEFYLNYPDLCEDIDQLVDNITDEMRPFLEEYETPEMKTIFSVGMKNLRSFLEQQEISFECVDGYEKSYRDNIFSDIYDAIIGTKFTEVSFRNEDVGAKGKVDLILDEDHIVDHKSGSKNSIFSVMRKSDIEEIDERPDFQAKMYLVHHRQYNTGDPIRFTYYHLLDNLRDVISGEGSHEDNELTIEYYPKGFNEMIQDEYIYDWLKSSNRREKVLDKLGYDDYKEFFRERDMPEGDKKDILKSDITEDLIEYCSEKIGSYKYVEKACKSIMKKLVVFRDIHYFKEELDRFEDFLEKRIAEYNDYRTSNFPVGDTDPDNIENKDLVITREARP